MGCAQSTSDDGDDRPLDDAIRGGGPSSGASKAAAGKKHKARGGTHQQHDEDAKPHPKAKAAAVPSSSKVGVASAAASAKQQAQQAGSSRAAPPNTLKAATADRLRTEESAARESITTAQERQRQMHLYDFEKTMPADSSRVPGSMSTIDFGIPDDEEEPEDRPRRSTMNSHEYDAAKHVRKTQATARDGARNQQGPVAPLSAMGVRQHQSEDDCWLIIRGKVYDVTELLDVHPGGSYAVFQHAGSDATRAFEDAHARKPFEHLQRYYKGEVTPPS